MRRRRKGAAPQDRASQDTARAVTAAKAVIDARQPIADRSAILVTLEHVVAAVLITVMNGDPRTAAAMLNEGLIPGVEARIAFYADPSRRVG